MVRNLMMILGLSLAVAAFGCSDDDATGTGGSCGSGGSGGAGGGEGGAGGDGEGGAGGGGGAPGGDACLDQADIDLLCGEGWTDTVSGCATPCAGAGECTADCLVEAGLSAGCADCSGAQPSAFATTAVSRWQSCLPPLRRRPSLRRVSGRRRLHSAATTPARASSSANRPGVRTLTS